MSKHFVLRLYWLAIITSFAILSLAGCGPTIDGEDYYEFTAEPEKLQQIEPLGLEAMETKVEREPARYELPAQQRDLTIEQCRALALENNLGIKVQLLSSVIAAKRVSEEEAKFEAAFFSRLGYSKTDTPTSTLLSGSKVDYSSVDLGVEVPLQTGGVLTFDLADSRTKTNNIFSTLNPAYDSRFSISISQPLLRNAGQRTNTYTIRIANYERQITDARTKLEMIRVISFVDRWYWRLYAARQEFDVRKKQYDLSNIQLAQARRFVDAGERPMIEVIRAEAGVAERLDAIIVAGNRLRDRERELKKLLNESGLEMQTPTAVIPATEPNPIHYELDRTSLIAKALDNRMEMLELELQIAADVSTIDYLQNQTLPLVTLDYTYNISGLGATRNKSFDMLTDKRFENHRVGLQLLVPLGNEAAKNRLLQAVYERRRRLTTRDNREAIIELEVLNAVDQLEANWQRILASRQNAILAGRRYKAETRQFELGLGTSTDVLDAQTAFADAQSAEISALAEYQIALVDLAYATGTLLGAAKVQCQPMVTENASK